MKTRSILFALTFVLCLSGFGGESLRENERMRTGGSRGSGEELRFWLQNSIAHHHFSIEEAAMATGLKPEEVKRRAEELGIQPGKVPPREDGDPLVILPYPGGRHPRIGFLDGAIDPLRETKASVFLPWEPGSYVVIDLPEAIFSSLGLTYLAHTHIPTIWDKKKISLIETEWRRGERGKLELTKMLPNGIAFGSRIASKQNGAEMELWLRNGTDAVLTGLRTQICLLLKGAKDFNAQSNENKVIVKFPWGEAMAVRSADGRRWIAVVWERSRAWANPRCPCFHSDPTLPDCLPGATVQVRGRFLIGEGSDPSEELNRLEALGKLLPNRSAAADPQSGVRVGTTAEILPFSRTSDHLRCLSIRAIVNLPDRAAWVDRRSCLSQVPILPFRIRTFLFFLV